MTERVRKGGLQVAPIWADFISRQALPGTGVDEAKFWAGLDGLVHDLAPRNRALLAKRAGCRPRSTPGTAIARASRTTRPPTRRS